MVATRTAPWKVSLHGGHSGEFCGHAKATLRETIQAAVDFGYHTYGVTEHAPRLDERFLYPEEPGQGYDVARLESEFEAYAQAIRTIPDEFQDRMTVLRGFEIEVVPIDRYIEAMRGYRERHAFDYIVGSVHYVDEIQIDGQRDVFERALAHFGGLENLARRYYRLVAEMAQALRPEVVGHLDLIRRNAPPDAPLDTPAIRRAAVEALEVVRDIGGILDVNTAGYRKGLGSPYPAPWLVRLADDMGVGLCFGDDSHSPAEVGAGIEEASLYLLRNGVSTIAYLTREDGALVRRTASLE